MSRVELISAVKRDTRHETMTLAKNMTKQGRSPPEPPPDPVVDDAITKLLEAASPLISNFFLTSCHITSAAMALIQITLIWVVYAVVLALLLATASIFVYVYQAPRERSAVVSIICIFTLTSLLATVLLLPVDVALVSSTTSSKLGRRKDWATQDRVDNITFTLRVVYYTLYSLDAILCLIIVPFTYFWYEEYDEVATEDGNQTFTSRLWGAFKYTIAFVLLVLIIFLVGFFVPVAKDREGAHYDYAYFKNLLRQGRKSLLSTD